MTTDAVKAFYVLRASRKKPMTERQRAQVDNLIDRHHAAWRLSGGRPLFHRPLMQNGDGSETDVEIFVRDRDSDRVG